MRTLVPGAQFRQRICIDVPLGVNEALQVGGVAHGGIVLVGRYVGNTLPGTALLGHEVPWPNVAPP